MLLVSHIHDSFFLSLGEMVIECTRTGTTSGRVRVRVRRQITKFNVDNFTLCLQCSSL